MSMFENHIREMAYDAESSESAATKLSDLKATLELITESDFVQIKHFHPKKRPETLAEAFKIYREHGRENWDEDAQETYQLKAVTDLLHGKRFIAVDYSGFYDGNMYFIYEFDDDFENANRLSYHFTLEEAIEEERRL